MKMKQYFVCVKVMFISIVAGFVPSFAASSVLDIFRAGTVQERFSNIVGCTDAKLVLQRAQDVLRSAQVQEPVGDNVEKPDAKVSGPLKSILLRGPGGCGKTMLAKALAGETGAALLHVRIPEDFLLNVSSFESGFSIEERINVIFNKALATVQNGRKGVVIIFDNLQLAAGDYVFAPVIKDLAGPNSYSFLRAEFRNSLIKIIERVNELPGKIVIIGCVTDLEGSGKLYPKEFEPPIDKWLADKFQATVALGRLKISEIAHLVNKMVAARGLTLDKSITSSADNLLTKLQHLSPKQIINLVDNACKHAQGAKRNQVELKDVDLSVTREHSVGEALSKVELRGQDLLGSGSKIYSAGQVDVKLDNIVVPSELREDLYLLADFVEHPQDFASFGGQVPKGTVFFGDVGVGKSTLAKAVAGQAGAALIEINCNRFSGNVSDVFTVAQKLGKSVVVLLDDVDVFAKETPFGQGPSHTLKKLVDDLDTLSSGLDSNITVFVTTKSLSLSVPELFKVGRLERIIEVGAPNVRSINDLLQRFVANKKLTMDQEDMLSQVARGSMGMSCTQLLDMVNRAAIVAKIADHKNLTVQDFETARSAVMHDGELWKNSKGDESLGASLRGDKRFFESPGKFFPPSAVKTTFSDVAGNDEAKDQLQEIINFLKDPEQFKQCGAKVPRGLLMTGPPGTGKTLLARAAAGEAGCPFTVVAASEFDDIYLGTGKNRVEALFKQARRYSPSIIFIDELDAVAAKRDGSPTKTGTYQTITQLLRELDGFETPEQQVVVIAATNRMDVLDAAITRPGRFDRKVVVELPNAEDREKILRLYAKKVPMDKSVDLQAMAKVTTGFSGADLTNLINEAALKINREKRNTITQADLEWARDRVYMGAENRILMKSKRSLKETAYHEAGHALMNLLQEPLSDQLHKVTIVPRGNALGITWSMPDEIEPRSSKEYFTAKIKQCMGGRAAEELVFGHLSAGARSDLEHATNIADKMITQYGMSSFGPVYFHENERYSNRSDAVQQKLDQEVHELLQQAYKDVLETLRKNRAKLDALANALLERETLTEEEVRTVVGIKRREIDSAAALERRL